MARKFTIGLGTVNLSVDNSVSLSNTGLSNALTLTSNNIGTKFAQVQSQPKGVDLTNSVSSSMSVESYYPTLFDAFNLKAIGTYNFYESDETTNVQQDASASLDSLPRYVTLTWGPAPAGPTLINANKSVRINPSGPPFVPATDVTKAKNSAANGYISPGVVTAILVPAITSSLVSTFSQDVFLSDPATAGLSAADHIDAPNFALQSVVPQSVLRVNFIDPSVAGAVTANRVTVASNPVHLVTLGAFSKLLPSLEVISEFNQDVPPKNSPPVVTVSTDSPTVAYVGYVIERYDVAGDGTMSAGPVWDIDGIDTTSLVDRAVVYGGRYAYRIRSVVQWSHPADVDFGGNIATVLLSSFDTSLPSSQNQASFYNGNWTDWGYASVLDDHPPDPPDELIVRPVSPKGIIDIVWKMPGNQQLDIDSLRLLRAVRMNGLLTDWTELGRFQPANGRYTDIDVSPFEAGHTSYVYAMYSTSLHGEVSTLTEQVEARLLRKTGAVDEYPLTRVRPTGVAVKAHAGGEPGSMQTELFAQDSATVYLRGAESQHPLYSKDYVVQVTSLSTGQRVEVDLSVETTDII